MISYRRFAPDLIVEATGVCDRQCPGCYAPNVISRESPLKLLAEKPELFLAPERLEQVLTEHLPATPAAWKSIGVRGGEPTRHPNLSALLRILVKCTQTDVYLETHGRWVLSGEDQLFSAIRETDTIIKLSFDRMHGLSAKDLEEITNTLSQRDIRWCVAITEASEEAFTATRQACGWIPDERIIFQRKVTTAQELLHPSAVIRCDGQLHSQVSVRPEFQTDMPLTEPAGVNP